MFKLRVYDLMERLTQNLMGPTIRYIGKSVLSTGVKLQGPLASDDRLVPSLRSKKYNQSYPQIEKSDFIAPNSVIIGDVQLGEKSSVWYGASLRGEISQIKIGNNSIIQDLVMIHPRKEKSTQIGDNVLIGPNCYLESCQIENNCFIGMGSTLRQGVQIESNSVVAPGAVVQAGQKVASNQIFAGNPARYLRDLTPEELQIIQEHHEETSQLARIHSEENELSFREQVNKADDIRTASYENQEEFMIKKLKDFGFPTDQDDEDFIEQRIYIKEPTSPQENEFMKKNYDPYEQDLFHFPDAFKVFGQNYEKYDELKKHFERNPDEQAKSPTSKTFREPKHDHSPWERKF